MKALVAASQCPHCGHLFDLRDSFGALLPLAHCPSCACDYPVRDGKCRWCGTAPDTRRLAASTMWKGVGVLAFAGMALGVWATRDAAPERIGGRPAPNDSTGPSRVLSLAPTDTPVVDATIPLAPTNDTLPVTDVPVAIESGVVATHAVPEPTNVDAPPPAPVVRNEAPVARTALPATRAPAAVVTPPKRVTPRAASRSAAVRWRSAVALNWVTVRSAPRHGARLLGSVGPDTRLQLGESRAGWVRVRMRGLSGWVHQARLSTRGARTETVAGR